MSSLSQKLNDILNRALLTMDSALAHLNHFWTTLPKQPYVALQPVFSFAESEVAHQIWATVCLPSCMDPSLRQIRGIRGWHSERMASKDAAFQAYVKLHQAGLVNDHLLPFRPEDLEAFERRPPFVSVPDQYDPWIDIAASWKTARSFYHKVISINRPGLSTFEIALVLPIHFRSLPDFPLHVDAGVTYSVSMHEQVVDEISTTSNLSLCRRVCDVILRSVHNEIMVGVANDFVVLFLPILEKQTLQGWLSHCSGSRPASTINFNENPLPEVGLLRDKGQPNSAFVSCHQYNSDRYISHHPWTREHNDQTTIPAKPLTTRRNFLHQDLCGRSLITNDVPAHHNRATTPINLPKDCCMVDCLPYDFAQYALLAPSILYRIEVGLVAEQLCTRMCPFVRFNQLGLVIDSICASCIHLQTNHEQFEFLGSSLLKIIITRQLFVNHTNWHEGYLSKQRDLSVSNSRLVEAALKAGLDEFVLTRNFNGHMWRPLCVSELGASSPRRERLLPVKLLASAVEALIGAAFLDNDLSNAIGCARFFLPEIKEWSWTALYDGTYITSRPRLMDFPPTFTNLEFLLGHRFHDKSLLVEAMTHPSCDWSISTCSYQRLAFLGDAVLEMIVTECLARDAHFLSRDKMHLCKAASTNAHFLAFLCMGASPVVEVFGNGEISDGNHSNTNSRESLHPWMFLRYSGVTIATGRDESLKRHAKYVGPIRSTLSNGLLYPWQDLAQLAADGFFSDIVQSLLGAIYIDSKGDLTHCKLFAEDIGILTHLRHFLSCETDLRHPKSRLSELVPGENVVYIHGNDTNGLRTDVCVVEINGCEVARVDGKYSKECLEIAGAELAMEKRSSGSKGRERQGLTTDESKADLPAFCRRRHVLN